MRRLVRLLQNGALLGLVSVAVTSCITHQLISPNQVRAGPALRSTTSGGSLPSAMRQSSHWAELFHTLHTIADYGKDKEHLVVFPQAGLLEPLGPSLATLGYLGVDIGQKVVDQEATSWAKRVVAKTRVLTRASCEQSRVANAAIASEALLYGHDNVGNPPDPLFTKIWIPVHAAPERLNAQCGYRLIMITRFARS